MVKILIKKKTLILCTAVFVLVWMLGCYYIINGKDFEFQYVKENSIEEQRIPNLSRYIPTGYGEMGRPVILPADLDLSPEIRRKVKVGWDDNKFNQYVSDLISVHRSLPDFRDDWCKGPNKYGPKLPKTSIIICFYNEAWSVLLRSVHSILDRSPPHLIEEIILIDDFSHMEHLKQQLVDYWTIEPKVKIIRNSRREGLIKSRLIGTSHAKAEILTFLDSHVEATYGWLEPLLDRIRLNHNTVVSPVIDVIQFDTLEYVRTNDIYVGGFDWNLMFTWHKIPEKEMKNKSHYSEPTRSPTMAGGLFSISNKFFEELGTYDPGFEIWGGENLEISFKTWMCGGTLEIVPCSHVGHIFRNSFPYDIKSENSSVNVMLKNSLRLAEVWLDDYKYYYHQRLGKIYGYVDYGDVSSRNELRKKLGCKSFKWYLENVYPELFVPDKIYGFGFIRTVDWRYCLDSWCKFSDLFAPVPLQQCHLISLGGSQFWYYSEKQEIRKEQFCIEYNEKNGNEVFLSPCQGNYGNQQWRYNLDFQFFIHTNSGKCLGVNNGKLAMNKCDHGDLYHKWFIENTNITAIKIL